MGLGYMHDNFNCIHTDIKPENIMFKYSEIQVLELVKSTLDRLLSDEKLPPSYGNCLFSILLLST